MQSSLCFLNSFFPWFLITHRDFSYKSLPFLPHLHPNAWSLNLIGEFSDHNMTNTIRSITHHLLLPKSHLCTNNAHPMSQTPNPLLRNSLPCQPWTIQNSHPGLLDWMHILSVEMTCRTICNMPPFLWNMAFFALKTLEFL